VLETTGRLGIEALRSLEKIFADGSSEESRTWNSLIPGLEHAFMKGVVKRLIKCKGLGGDQSALA